MFNRAAPHARRHAFARRSRAAAVLAAVALLAACNGEGPGSEPPTPTPPTLSPSLLSRYFVESFAPYADAAQRLLTVDARYTAQLARVGNWLIGGEPVTISGSPIEGVGAHYAHAAGLSGAGQTIAISDTGFLTTHEVFAGTSVTVSGAPPVDDHGTFVASVAAGNSSNMVGVAPGAALILGSNSGTTSLTDVVNLARRSGAVAVNNSWTFADLEANPVDYNTLFAFTDGAAYLAALKSYHASGGVVVWAAPNDVTAAGVGLMAALPVLEPDLETGWLAVVNGLPTLSGDDVVAARRLSAACLEAAAWCLAADGTWIGAEAGGVAAYDVGTGTSYAAPVVSGALALLGEAFPDLTPQQLRVRLLASSDNSFVGFRKSGSVELVPGFTHDVSEEWGHGFLDVAAALMPIGPTTLATSSGAAYPTSRPLAVETPATGDAVARALSSVDLLGRDALGAGFRVEAPSLVAARAPAPLHARQVADLAAGLAPTAYADNFLTGPMVSASAAGGTVLGAALPRGGGAESYGLRASRDFPTEFGSLSLMAGAGYDAGALLPTLLDAAGAPLAFAGLGARFELASGLDLKVSVAGAAAGGATLDAASLKVSAGDPLGLGGTLSVGLALPPAVTSGHATLTLPILAASGAAELQDFELGLAPATRELRQSVSYAVPLARGVDALVSLEFARDRGNVAGRAEASALLGIVARF